jgi:hypothetical protein
MDCLLLVFLEAIYIDNDESYIVKIYLILFHYFPHQKV